MEAIYIEVCKETKHAIKLRALQLGVTIKEYVTKLIEKDIKKNANN